MSFDPERSMSFDHGERALREHVNYNPPIELQDNNYPDDFAEGWEHYQQYHICWHCGRQGHESSMERNALHYWIHTECQNDINETINKL
jgi:hypothetical protein